jgi:hypothetical protein
MARAAAGPSRGRVGLIATAAAAISFAMVALAIAGATVPLQLASPRVGIASGSGSSPLFGVSSLVARDVPAPYLLLYRRAAARYGIDWAILAGIGRVECDHGRDHDPSCSRPGAVNQAGAGGPMQFLASTWSAYGLDANGDGSASRWDPADAVYAAANYLRASGAPPDYHGALLHYNHAEWYVTEVMSWAGRYRAPATASREPPGGEGDEGGGPEGSGAPGGGLEGSSPTPVRFVSGERTVLSQGDGHLALVPAAAPVPVQAMVVAGNELQDLPYGPGGHPDPRGAFEEDCSSTVNYVLYRSGVRPISEILGQNPLAQDYPRYGSPGPGRWVTIYSTTEPTPHVFILIAGLRLDTSHAGTDVGPNRSEDGPRWRILDHIPTWAHWSVRHPPGL